MTRITPIRHGLPDVYPYNEPGYVESMVVSPNTRQVVYRGVSDDAQWHLRDGVKLELWQSGDLFNEYGTWMGRLDHVG